MICTSPIKLDKYPDKLFRCRKCLSCQITKRQEWSIRAVYESLKYKKNCFLTLTFRDSMLPPKGVNTRDLQLFFKRLRKYISKTSPDTKVKYIACGEYGEKLFRPHYHILLFNYDFDDKVFFKRTKKGELIYRSSNLENLWTFGHSSIGELNHATASYVAGYVHKKFYNKDKEKVDLHYTNMYGEVCNKEFIVCSKGISKDFFLENKEQLYNRDYLIYNGKKFALPEYFNYLIKKDNIKAYDKLKFRRSKHIVEHTELERKAIAYNLRNKFSKRNTF